MIVRSWNLYFGNSVPRQRRGFVDEMIQLATADQPDVLCLQEVPAWALSQLSVGDVAARPPFGVRLGRALTTWNQGLVRAAVAGQGLGVWLAPTTRLLEHRCLVLNPRWFRAQQARALRLPRAARWAWAKERRIAQAVRVTVQDRPHVVVNLHCTGVAGDNRVGEAELLRAANFGASLAGPDDVLVLAGDFNLRQGESQTLARLTGPGWDFSAPGPGIDHVMVRGAGAAALRVWPKPRRRLSPNGPVLSDHAPVEVVVRDPSAAPAVA